MRSQLIDPHPLIIIGAARSGTNALRDLLTSTPGFVTWPCDEINYIWRHGNATWPTDEFSAEMATPSVIAFIRREFLKVQRRHPGQVIVEKTCANSLRIPFIAKVLPEARYALVLRDGRDVAASAVKRWRAKLDLAYVLRKARFVPLSDIPYYGAKYLANRIAKLISSEQRLSTWGPRFKGLEQALHEVPLHVLCAIQWQRCVEKMAQDIEDIEPAKRILLRYEELARNPEREFGRLIGFLSDTGEVSPARRPAFEMRTGSIGKHRTTLTSTQVREVESTISRTLERFGYTAAPTNTPPAAAQAPRASRQETYS